MSDEILDLDQPKSLAMTPFAPIGPTELQPRYPQAASYYGVEKNDEFDLREFWRRVRMHKWLILTIVTLVTTSISFAMYRAKSSYQASTVIEIGKDNATMIKTGDLVIQNDDADPQYLVNIKTRMLMLTSRSLLEDVIIKLKIDQHPRFLEETQKKGVMERIFGIMPEQATSEPLPAMAEGTLDRSPAESARLAPFVALLEDKLSVQQVRDTRALKVSFTDTDPVIAAGVVNGMAQEFIQRNFQSKTERFTSTAGWLDRSTRELKSKVEQAEQELATYTREHNIFSFENKETLTTNKLSTLHDQATRAETDRMLKESLYQEVTQGRVAQLPEAFADMIFKGSATPEVTVLQKQLSELATSAAQISVKYGPEHPRMLEIRQQMTTLQEQIGNKSKALEEKLKSDYERAMRDEQSLKGALTQAKSEAVHENQAAIQYNILKQDVDTAKSLYTDFLQKTNQAKVQVAEQHSNIRVIDPGQVPTQPAGPKRLLMILIGFTLSLGAGVGLALFLEYFDNSVKSIEDVARYAQIPTLAIIPTMAVAAAQARRFEKKQRKAISKRVSTAESEEDENKLTTTTPQPLPHAQSLSVVAEAYRTLRTSVLLSTAGRAPKTILFTSSRPGEGKSTTTINTAISLAQLNATVLVIDCDLRKPVAHKMLGLGNGPGLSTYLSRDIEINGLIRETQVPNLSVIPCGPIPPNPAELISSDRMRDLLRELAGRFDHILIDSPPLMNVTDPVILSTMVDGVVIVVHGGETPREHLRRARQELASVNAKIFGVVLNNLDIKRQGYDDYYYYKYSYTYSEAQETKQDARRAAKVH